MSGALDLMLEQNLEFKYPIRDRKISIAVADDATPERLLFRAALANYLQLARDLLSRYDIDLNKSYELSHRQVTSLRTATVGQYGEMVELLLDAGADPNFPIKGNRTPLAIAVKNHDTRSTRAFFKAGATIKDAFGRRGVNSKILRDLAEENKFEIVELLLANGVEIKPPKPRLHRLTPLMQALAGGRSKMALALLPYSDPRFYTKIPYSREISGGGRADSGAPPYYRRAATFANNSIRQGG